MLLFIAVDVNNAVRLEFCCNDPGALPQPLLTQFTHTSVGILSSTRGSHRCHHIVMIKERRSPVSKYYFIDVLYTVYISRGW